MYLLPVNNFSNVNKTKTSFKRASGMSGNMLPPSPRRPERHEESMFGKFSRSELLYLTIIAHILVGHPLVNKLDNDMIDKELKKYEIPAPKNDDLKTLVDNPKYSKAFYQLSKLRDIDKPDVKKISDNLYLANLKMGGKNIAVTMYTGELEKNKLSGVVVDGSDKFEYSAVLKQDDTKTVEVEFVDKSDTLSNKKIYKKVFVRDVYGELSVVENGKKTVLNKEAAESFKMVRDLNNYRAEINRDYADSRDGEYLFGILITLLRMRMKKDDDEEMRRREKLRI